MRSCGRSCVNCVWGSSHGYDVGGGCRASRKARVAIFTAGSAAGASCAPFSDSNAREYWGHGSCGHARRWWSAFASSACSFREPGDEVFEGFLLATKLPKSKNILQLPPQTRATSQQTEFERYFSFLCAAVKCSFSWYFFISNIKQAIRVMQTRRVEYMTYE